MKKIKSLSIQHRFCHIVLFTIHLSIVGFATLYNLPISLFFVFLPQRLLLQSPNTSSSFFSILSRSSNPSSGFIYLPPCEYKTNVNPSACSDNVFTPLDDDVICSTFFYSEFVKSTSDDITQSSAEILPTSAILGYGTDRTPDNYCKRKYSSPAHDHSSPDHRNASSSFSQCNKPCPVVGQVFPSYELVVQSYYDFASVMGFSVRLGSTKNVIDKGSGQKILVMKRLLCSKQGSPSLIFPPTNGNRRKNGVSRCCCLASIKFKRIDRSDNWVTDTVIFYHNHPFTSPSKIRYLPINRSISQISKLLFSSLAEVNVPVSQQATYFSNQLGGVQNMGCMKMDINNMVCDDRIDLKNYDVDLIVEEFEMNKSENEQFFYDLVKDDEGRLKHLFWADPTMIENYKLFGNSVTFDTTYKINVYSMVFGMFCGVNHHRKTTIFGSAFVRYFLFTFFLKLPLSLTLIIFFCNNFYSIIFCYCVQ
ncbi:hypothetical protein ZOSMA_51G00500 [Zostera marina]|uniref:FAR1 domain-containing protein n=1 Tax=Zostera marina TaxID=29655 RepID=A0A0K9NXU2_ZOSMR|nr:hypothetical protein ZOSMA_51G00500 [Zostera marina]